MPDSTVSGSNVTEMLQDMVHKNRLFILNISKTEENQKETWDANSVEVALGRVKKRLEHLFNMSMPILHDRNITVPSLPGSLNIIHTHDYAKKEYGWHVIKALETWVTHVQQFLQETNVCCC